MSDFKTTLIAHLEELRQRIIICLIIIGICALFSYYRIDAIMSLFTRFFDRVVFIAPQEAFVTYVKIAFFSGFLLSLPVVLFQVWRFVEAALTNFERMHLILYGSASLLLFISGLFFCYYLILPWAISFLLSFQTEKIVPMVTVSNLTTFCLMLLFSFAVIFELPLVTVFLSQVGIVTPASLARKRKHVIVAVFILSAMITPPDAVTQIMLAIPLVGLYEIGILFSRLTVNNKKPGG